jgi:hypothetical protein
MKVWRRCQLASAHESAALLLDYRHVSSARRRSDVSALVDSPRQRLLLETWRGEAQLLHLPQCLDLLLLLLVLQLLCLLCLLLWSLELQLLCLLWLLWLL